MWALTSHSKKPPSVSSTATGKVVWRGRCSSDPDAIARMVRERAPFVVRIGLETGQLSTWLVHSLRRLDLPVVCLDARHAKAALSLQVNKTDDNDAHGLAQIVRTGWYREVAVKSMDSQAVRVLLMARAQLISQRQATANQIRGLLKTFGLRVGQAGGSRFAVRVRELVADHPVLVAIVEPLLTVWQTLREQVAELDRQVRMRVREDAAARRLMTAPGVGAVVALAYTAVIDDPARFAKSASVGAYLGLTPRRYQSGEVDCDGHISQLRRRPAAQLPVRGGQRRAEPDHQALRAEDLGAGPGPADRRAQGQGRRRPQAGGRPAPHVA